MAQENELQKYVERNFPWNFSVNIMDLVFYTLGINMIARQTILPLLMSHLTTSKLAIGLIPAIDSMGFLLPQLLFANFTEGLRRKLPFIVTVSSFGERGPYLAMGVVVWFFAASAPGPTAAAILILLAVSTFMSGVTMPAWYDMIAKVIPAKRRGIWSGLGFGLGALLGVLGAAVAGRILVEQPFPQNFAWCFLIGFAALTVSWVGLALNREPDSPSIKTGTKLTTYLRRLPAVLRRDQNYLRFLAARSMSSMGAMAGGFYVVYGSQRWGMSGEDVAILTGILIGSQAVMNVVWGAIGDHRGHKFVLCFAPVSFALAAALATFAPSSLWLWPVFALLGSATAANNVSNMNIVLEFCAPEDRPTYIGMTNSMLAPVAIIAPIIGSLLATLLGYQGMFVVAGVLAVLAAAAMSLWVREPRHIIRQSLPG